MDDFNITSAQYLEMDSVNTAVRIVVDGKTMDVPLDTSNRHYIAVMDWASQDGNTIADAD